MTTTRKAQIFTHDPETVKRYLPSNYSLLPTETEFDFIIEGTDVAGWTLDGYVIPRLESGLHFAKEILPPTCATPAAGTVIVGQKQKHTPGRPEFWAQAVCEHCDTLIVARTRAEEWFHYYTKQARCAVLGEQ